MPTDTELERLLHDRFEVGTVDFVAALQTLPAIRPSAAALSADDARLLDEADFTEDHDALVTVGTATAGHAARLAVTALTADEVATALGVSASRVRQKRIAGELWAIPDGNTWLFPVLQFESDASRRPGRQIRGLDRVFKALPPGLHPVAVAQFLTTPQPGLFHGRPTAPLDWLREGGDIDDVVDAAAGIDWHTA
jgi:hypothetical protein